MPRFFVPNEQIDMTEVHILGDDARHIARSLRMAVGDMLTVCDREGREYACRLSYIRDERVSADIVSVTEGTAELPVFFTLYMAYPKGDKLETVVQKAVELGASRIVPFISSRCIKVPRAEREQAQHARLVRIAEEAAKQCGRTRLPEVAPTLTFPQMLQEGAKEELALFCYEDEHALSLKAALTAHTQLRRIAAVVGCEGGFSPEEAQAARDAGFVTVHLGPRILRCETAPSYVLSAVGYQLEL